MTIRSIENYQLSLVGTHYDFDETRHDTSWRLGWKGKTVVLLNPVVMCLLFFFLFID